MSSQEQITPLSQNYSEVAGHKNICCLFLSWDDATEEKMKEISELESVLRERYGAFTMSEVVEHTDFEYSERSFWYLIENFIKKNDSRDSLLIIFYSGCTYVHEKQLYLEPHRHTEPSVRWSESLYRRLLARLLLVFDTTALRERHYDQFWSRIKTQSETLEDWGKILSLLSINGAETQLLIDALKVKAMDQHHGFTVSDLCNDIQGRQKNLPVASIYRPHSKRDKLTDIMLVPLARPRLQLYGHVEIADPHRQYLQDYTEIHKDGVCEVIKMRMGPDLQEFSATLGWGPSCVVAIKRFTLKGRRALHLPDQFVRERENLKEVSRWRHKHILGMLASFETTGGKFKTLNIILPFADAVGGNLYNFLRLESDSRWELSGYPTSSPSLVGCLADWRYAVYRETIGLVDAVAELHSGRNGRYMTHRDIKPSNVLIQKGTFKLADFGLSELKDSDETSKTTWFLGTELYSPPEKDSLMGRGRDVWALGCVLLEIALMIRFAFQPVPAIDGRYPGIGNMIDVFYEDRKASSKETGFEETAIFHKTMKCVHWNIKAFEYMRPGWRRRIIIDGMVPVILKMLEEDPMKRISASVAAAALEEHYHSLQADPQLRRLIEVRDNPGGPSADDPSAWNPRDVTSRMQGQPAGLIPLLSMKTSVHLPKTKGSSPSEHLEVNLHTQDGPFPRPPLPRRLPASYDSSGATGQLEDLGLQEKKRPASEEMDSGNKKRPWNVPQYDSPRP